MKYLHLHFDKDRKLTRMLNDEGVDQLGQAGDLKCLMFQLNDNLSSNVGDFHRHFEMAYDGPPRLLPEKLKSQRSEFLNEERREFDESQTVEQAFDAMLDLIYVAVGTIHLMGMEDRLYEGWARVHRANMEKVRQYDAENYKFGLIKPEGWKAPDHSDLVKK